jgi:hypothetical protein
MTNHHAHDSSSNLWLTGVIGSASSAQTPGIGAPNGANSVRWEHDILMDPFQNQSASGRIFADFSRVSAIKLNSMEFCM